MVNLMRHYRESMYLEPIKITSSKADVEGGNVHIIKLMGRVIRVNIYRVV